MGENELILKEVIFERHGTVAQVGDVTVSVPEGRLFLGLFAPGNEFFDGDDFQEDGWVYRDGKRSRRWFAKVDDTVVRRERALDLPALEEKRHRFMERHWRRMWDEYHVWAKKLAEVGEAHAIPTHRYELYENKTTWLYNSSEWGIGFDWVKDPGEFKNLEIGQGYYHAARHSTIVNGYLRKFDVVIDHLVGDLLFENDMRYNREWNRPVVMVVTINGREYIYNHINEKHWARLGSPEDEHSRLQRMEIGNDQTKYEDLAGTSAGR